MLRLKSKKIIHLAALAVVILFVLSLSLSLKAPLLDILNFPLKVTAIIGREVTGVIFSHRNLAQNNKLAKQVYLLKQRLVAMQDIALENSRLKKALHLKETAPYKVISANVVGRSADNWSSVIFIDKGSLQGIKNGSVALSYLGLIGRVLEAAKYTSKVLLANDPDFAVSGIIQRSRQEGLISGTLGNFLLMKYLPIDADVRLKDLVLSSGLTHNFPKGLLIGSVAEVGEENSGLSRYCLIKPALNFSSLEEVLIIVE